MGSADRQRAIRVVEREDRLVDHARAGKLLWARGWRLETGATDLTSAPVEVELPCGAAGIRRLDRLTITVVLERMACQAVSCERYLAVCPPTTCSRIVCTDVAPPRSGQPGTSLLAVQ